MFYFPVLGNGGYALAQFPNDNFIYLIFRYQTLSNDKSCDCSRWSSRMITFVIVVEYVADDYDIKCWLKQKSVDEFNRDIPSMTMERRHRRSILKYTVETAVRSNTCIWLRIDSHSNKQAWQCCKTWWIKYYQYNLNECFQWPI